MTWGVSPWVYPVWDSLGFLDLGGYFLPQFREVFNYYLLKYFLMVFLFVFFFWDSYNLNIGAFNPVLKVSEIVLITFNSFFFFPLYFIYFYHSIFYLTYPIFCLCYSTVGSLQCFLSHLLHYPLYIDCFQDFGSFSLSLFGILYQVDSLSLPLLFGLVGIYPVPLPAG